MGFLLGSPKIPPPLPPPAPPPPPQSPVYGSGAADAARKRAQGAAGAGQDNVTGGALKPADVGKKALTGQ